MEGSSVGGWVVVGEFNGLIMRRVYVDILFQGT